MEEMEEQLLNRIKKNEIYLLLKNYALPTNDFTWIEEPSDYTEYLIVSKLLYRYEDLFFKFDFHSGMYRCKFSPGPNKPVEGTPQIKAWGRVKALVILWAIELKKEIDAPNLWEKFEKYQEEYRDIYSLVSLEKLADVSILVDKLKKIDNKIPALVEEIEKKFNLDIEQKNKIHKLLEYLAEAGKEIKRVDYWLYIFRDLLIEYAILYCLTSQQATELGKFIIEFLFG